MSRSDGHEARAHEEVPRSSAPPCLEFPIEFSTNVPADTGLGDPLEIRREMPFDGHVTELMVGFPAGAGGAVGVQFRRVSGSTLFPYNTEDQYIAQDDIQHPYSMCASVREEETMVAQYVNTDVDNDHFINVIASVREAHE